VSTDAARQRDLPYEVVKRSQEAYQRAIADCELPPAATKVALWLLEVDHRRGRAAQRHPAGGAARAPDPDQRTIARRAADVRRRRGGSHGLTRMNNELNEKGAQHGQGQ